MKCLDCGDEVPPGKVGATLTGWGKTDVLCIRCAKAAQKQADDRFGVGKYRLQADGACGECG